MFGLQGRCEAPNDLRGFAGRGSGTRIVADSVQGSCERRMRLPAGRRMSESVGPFSSGPELENRIRVPPALEQGRAEDDPCRHVVLHAPDTPSDLERFVRVDLLKWA